MPYIIITIIFLRKIRDNDVNRKRSINIERLLKINERSISVGFDRPGVIFDHYLMPLTSQVRNFMLNLRAHWGILFIAILRRLRPKCVISGGADDTT